MDLKEQLIKSLDKLIKMGYNMEQLTLWDLFVALITDRFRVWIATLKADMEILELLVKGNSPAKLMKKFNVPSIEIYTAALTWGIFPVDVTTEFDPELFYEEGISIDTFMNRVNPLIERKITRSTADKLISNIIRLKELKEILNEYED